MKFIKFLGAILSHNGEPSSKRVAGFSILFFTMVMYAVKGGMQYEFFVTWLGAALVSLGISTIEKLGEIIKRPKQ